MTCWQWKYSSIITYYHQGCPNQFPQRKGDFESRQFHFDPGVAPFYSKVCKHNHKELSSMPSVLILKRGGGWSKSRKAHWRKKMVLHCLHLSLVANQDDAYCISNFCSIEWLGVFIPLWGACDSNFLSSLAHKCSYDSDCLTALLIINYTLNFV